MKESNVLISQAEMSDTKVQASIHARHSISRGTIRGLPLSLLTTDNPSRAMKLRFTVVTLKGMRESSYTY